MGSPSNMKSDDKLLRKRLNARLRQQRCRARKRAVQKKHQDIQEMVSPSNSNRQQQQQPMRYLENDIVSSALQRHLEIKSFQNNNSVGSSRRCSISSSMLDTSGSISDSSVSLSGQQSPLIISRDSLPPGMVRSDSYNSYSKSKVVSPSPTFDHEDESRRTAIDAMLSLRSNVFFNRNNTPYPMDTWRAKNVVWSRNKCVVPKWTDMEYHSRIRPSFEPAMTRPHFVPVPIVNTKLFSHVRYMNPY